MQRRSAQAIAPFPNGLLHLFLLVAVLLSGTALRLHQLGASGLWVDEIFTARFAAPANTLAEVAEGPLNSPLPTPPLWFWITHVGLRLFGNSDFTVRVPSAFFGILGIAAIYKLGAALFGDRRVGLVAACLLALSPTHVHYAREARFYTIVPFLGMLSIYFLHRGLRNATASPGGTPPPSREAARPWIAFTLVTLINLYIHLTAFLILAAQGIYVAGRGLYARIDRSSRKKPQPMVATVLRPPYGPFLACLLILTLCYAPMVPHVLAGIRGERGLGGGREAMERMNLTPAYILGMFSFFGAGTGVPLALYGSAALWGIANTWRKYGRHWALFALMIGLPYALILILQPKHWFAYKYVITVLPLYVLAIAVGLRALAQSLTEAVPVSIAAALTASTLGYGALTLPALHDVYQPRPGAERWQILAHILEADVAQEDTVAFLPLTIATMSPGDIVAHYDPEALGFTTVQTVAEVEHLLARHHRVWIIQDRSTDLTLAEEILSWLETQAAVHFALPGPLVLHYLGAEETAPTLLAEAQALPYLNAPMVASIASTQCALEMREECTAAFEQATALDPENGQWPYRLALHYDEWGDFEAAKSAYLQAIALSPQEPRYHAALGAFYARNDRGDAAILAYDEAIRLYRSAHPNIEDDYYLNIWRNAVAMLRE